jgi:hypothetical protein
MNSSGIFKRVCLLGCWKRGAGGRGANRRSEISAVGTFEVRHVEKLAHATKWRRSWTARVVGGVMEGGGGMEGSRSTGASQRGREREKLR